MWLAIALFVSLIILLGLIGLTYHLSKLRGEPMMLIVFSELPVFLTWLAGLYGCGFLCKTAFELGMLTGK